MHKEYIRIVENADTAVLFIHGIIGTPNHFADYVKLVPQNISVYNILLDGHGKTVEDFSHTSMLKWKKQVEDAVCMLSQSHKNIIITAHSMGTLFALNQAVLHPDKIKELFLIASPLKVRVKPRMFTSATKIYFELEDDKYSAAARQLYGIDDKQNIFKYAFWAPRYKELFSEILNTRKIVKDVKVKTQVFQSFDDELVAVEALKYLAVNEDFEITMLKKSSHFYYDKKDYDILLNAFVKTLDSY